MSNHDIILILADMAELADAHDSGSCGATRAGSSPVIRTKFKNNLVIMRLLFLCYLKAKKSRGQDRNPLPTGLVVEGGIFILQTSYLHRRRTFYMPFSAVHHLLHLYQRKARLFFLVSVYPALRMRIYHLPVGMTLRIP